MVIAFCALLLSEVLALQQLGFMLVVSAALVCQTERCRDAYRCVRRLGGVDRGHLPYSCVASACTDAPRRGP